MKLFIAGPLEWSL